ncbi:MAG: hypothetical protein WA191_10835, partial [Telluria sp.]
MDRVPTHPDFVAQALQCIGLPACACDAAGVVRAANAELRELLGLDITGRRLSDLFAATAVAQAAPRLHAAADAAQCWD